MDIKKILYEILNIIDYKEDKDKFVNDFLQNCLFECYLILLEELPESALMELNNKIDIKHKDVNYLFKILDEYCTKEKIKDTLAQVEAKRVQEFVSLHLSKKDPKINEQILLLVYKLRKTQRSE